MRRRVAGEPRATVRVARVITLVAAAAGLLLGLTASRDIIAGAGCLHPAFTPVAVGLVFGGLGVITMITLVSDLRVIRLAHGTYAILFLVAQAAWPFALTEPMPENLNPWIVELTALGTVPAAIAWRPWAVWGYLGVLSVLVFPVRFASNGGQDWAVPLQFVLLTPTLAALFTALAIVAMRNAESVDAAARELTATTARSAAARARTLEERRLDALVHDEVMSTLFYASRGDSALDESVRTQARAALDDLEHVRSGRVNAPDGVEPDGFVSRIRSAVLDVSIAFDFTARVTRVTPVPGEVASAFAEATSEAARNSITHAGDAATRRVTAVIEERGVEVRIYDTGAGFDAREVEPHRLGILVSIRGRFATIPGGLATVTSYPGAGTLVALTWRQP